jgi:hypothetical protein
MIVNEPWWTYMPGMGVQWQGINAIFMGYGDTPEEALIVPLGKRTVSPVPTHELLPVVIHPGTAGWIPVLKAKGALSESFASMGSTMLDSLAKLIRPAYEDYDEP